MQTAKLRRLRLGALGIKLCQTLSSSTACVLAPSPRRGPLSPTDDPELVQAMMVAFGRRYRDILDRFQNTEDRNAGKFVKTLTSEERRCECH